MRKVVLFTRETSVYEELGCDCYSKERNALNYTGDSPVIAHPPCRAWGTMKHWAKPEPGERELALWAVDLVNKNGGIVEHPLRSGLWKEADLSKGFLYAVNQVDYGHVCSKPTYFYIVGIEPRDMPKPLLSFLEPTHQVQSSRKKLKWANKAQREGTPPMLAIWLIKILGEIYENKRRSNIGGITPANEEGTYSCR
jgi:hypothetical protein